MLKPLISPMSSDLAKPIFYTYVLKLIALLIMQTYTTEERVDPVKNRKTLACSFPMLFAANRSLPFDLHVMNYVICYTRSVTKPHLQK